MKLLLRKTQQELSQNFKVAFSGDETWQVPNAEGLSAAGAHYPVITNERPVSLQVLLWGFPLYLDENQTLLKNITEVGIESILEKPMFACIHQQRCLVPFEMADSPTLLYGAGIWETYRQRRKPSQKRFVLLTTKSKDSSGRVPFVLTGKAYKQWLSEEEISTETLQELFGLKY